MRRICAVHRIPAATLARAARLLAAVAAHRSSPCCSSGCESMSSRLARRSTTSRRGSAPRARGAARPDDADVRRSLPGYDRVRRAAAARGRAATRDSSRPTADARVARAGNERWLVVKATPEEAWQRCATSGPRTASSSPSSSRRWASWKPTGRRIAPTCPQDFLQQFASKYVSFANDTYKRDKFRTRIERGTRAGHGRDLHQPPRRRADADQDGSGTDRRRGLRTGRRRLRIRSSKPSSWRG